MIRKNIKQIADMLKTTFIGSDNHECHGIELDSRKVTCGNLFIPIKGENCDGHKFAESAVENGANILLWNREFEIPDSLKEKAGFVLVEDTTNAFQQLAIEYRKELKAKFIGITGSNGKTSTKDILAGILSRKFKTQKTLGNNNNELGVPKTILSLDEDVEMAIIEMGVDNKGDLLFLNKMVKPDYGVLTNVGAAHLYHFNSIEDIADAKIEMIECVNDGGYFIYNDDNKYIKDAMNRVDLPNKINYLSFGNTCSSDIYFTNLITDENGVKFNCHGFIDIPIEIDLLGKHQSYNSLSAIAIAKLCGMNEEEIIEGLKLIEPTGLRNELLKVNSMTILNDSYKSNPESVYAAMDTFEELKSPFKIVVLGDMLGLGKAEKEMHTELCANMEKYEFDKLVLIGIFAEDMKLGALNYMDEKEIYIAKNNDDITDYLLGYLDKECTMVIKASRDLQLDEVVNNLKNN